MLSNIEPKQRFSYTQLVSALNERFEPNMNILHKSSWRHFRRKHKQSLSEVAQDVKRLTRMAYPNIPQQFRNELEVDCFVNSLSCFELKWEILRQNPCSLNECLQHGLKFESFITAQKLELNRKSSVANINTINSDMNIDNTRWHLSKIRFTQSSSSKSVIVCSFCNTCGHKKKTCHTYLKHKQTLH